MFVHNAMSQRKVSGRCAVRILPLLDSLKSDLIARTSYLLPSSFHCNSTNWYSSHERYRDTTVLILPLLIGTLSTMSVNAAFQRLLSFFSHRSPHPDTNTITFLDSLRGDLSIGLDFPVALMLATIRHLVFRNTGFFSLSIYVPTVRTSRTLLGGPDKFNVDEDKRYTRGELIALAKDGGIVAQADAFGLWALAAEPDGKVKGEEVRMFQRGEIMERVAARRRGRENVLPLWRGGPIS